MPVYHHQFVLSLSNFSKITLPYCHTHNSSSGQQITQFGLVNSTSAEVQAHSITTNPVVKPHCPSVASTTFLCTTQNSNATNGEMTRYDKRDHVLGIYSNLVQTNRRSTNSGTGHRVLSCSTYAYRTTDDEARWQPKWQN